MAVARSGGLDYAKDAKMKIEVRRPEVLRWIMLAAIVVLFAMTLIASIDFMSRATFPALVLALFAAVIGWFGQALLFTKARAVIFEGDRLYDDSGVEICHLDNVAEIEKGLHLFKPSSGFVLKLRTRQPAGWSPGLWWRVGHRVGVGGATPGRRAKAMADAIVMYQGAETTQKAVAEIEAKMKPRKKR